MTKVRTSDGKLVIDVEGWDKLWAFKSRLEIPVNHIGDVRSGADERASGAGRVLHACLAVARHFNADIADDLVLPTGISIGYSG